MFNRDPERILLLKDLRMLNHFPAKFVAASDQRDRSHREFATGNYWKRNFD
jgi:hypothetical protein